jgi:hypothetical protein
MYCYELELIKASEKGLKVISYAEIDIADESSSLLEVVPLT